MPELPEFVTFFSCVYVPVIAFPSLVIISYPLFAVSVPVVATVFQAMRPVPFILRYLPYHYFSEGAIFVHKTTVIKESCACHMVLYTITKSIAIVPDIA